MYFELTSLCKFTETLVGVLHVAMEDSGGETDSFESSSSEDELPRAKEAENARKRSLSRSNQPSGKRTRVSGGPSTKTKRVSAASRLQEFPSEPFSLSMGRLYCNACHLPLQTKKSIIRTHIGTERHAAGKKSLEKTAVRQKTISASWDKYQKKHASEVVGTGMSSAVPKEVANRRIDVVETFLRAGVPLAKVTYLRPLLEAGNLRLTDRSHLAQYIPLLTDTEMERIKNEVESADYLSVIFDGSTYQGEALAILLRYLDGDWKEQQRLVRFHLLAKSLTGAQLARELVEALSTTLQLKPGKLIAGTRDGAAVNRVAMEHIKTILYPDILDVICMSHSLDNVGRHFDTPILTEFLQWWTGLFSRSPAARLLWKERTGVAVKSMSGTRWWSAYEVAVQLMDLFGDVGPFLQECTVSPSACQHLKRIIAESEDILKVELAVTVDAAKVFVKKTYVLEGDGILSTEAYGHLQEVATAAGDAYYPNVDQVVQQIAGDNDNRRQELTAHARHAVQPAINYFLRRFNNQEGDLFPIVKAFKAARLCSPHFVFQSKPPQVQVDSLRVFPALSSDDAIQPLKEELPAYIAAAEDISPDISTAAWWLRQQSLPAWKRAAKVILTVQPSSAAAERVFSLLQAATSSQQSRLLEDSLQVAIMLQYNRGRKVDV